MVSLLSRWKNLVGEQNKEVFDRVEPKTNVMTDGSFIDVSPDFIAVNWFTGGGGGVGILQTTNFIRCESRYPVIRGHTSPVTDLKFSPFMSNLLATGSEDSTIKLWTIPEGGLKEDMTAETQLFNSHNRKVSLLNFNPCVKEVIASAGTDLQLNVWNIMDSSILAKFKLDDQAYSLEWNRVGSLISTSTKHKKINIFDVRSTEDKILSTSGHESAKPQKSGFVDENYLYSVGNHSSGYREFKLFDIRKFDAPALSHKIDTMTAVLTPYYDHDTGLIFFSGKGESTIIFAEIKEGTYKAANSYSANDQGISSAFFPKRTMDYNSCELARCAKLTKDQVQYVSFKYPRRNSGYAEEFYPECELGEPSMSLEEWQKGESKPLARKKIHEIENKFKSEVIFHKKDPETKKEVSVEDVLKENEELKKKVEQLEQTITELKQELEAKNQN